MALRKVYIDLGARTGDSVLDFIGARKSAGAEKFGPGRTDFEIHAFEPSTGSFLVLQRLLNNLGNAYAHNAIAYIADDLVEFSCDDGKALDYCIAKYDRWRKKPRYIGRVKRKPCIDFIRWFKKTCVEKPADYVVLKMDIEGAEFDILPLMISSGLIAYVSELYVEFHNDLGDAVGLKEALSKLTFVKLVLDWP